MRRYWHRPVRTRSCVFLLRRPCSRPPAGGVFLVSSSYSGYCFSFNSYPTTNYTSVVTYSLILYWRNDSIDFMPNKFVIFHTPPLLLFSNGSRFGYLRWNSNQTAWSPKPQNDIRFNRYCISLMLVFVSRTLATSFSLLESQLKPAAVLEQNKFRRDWNISLKYGWHSLREIVKTTSLKRAISKTWNKILCIINR